MHSSAALFEFAEACLVEFANLIFHLVLHLDLFLGPQVGGISLEDAFVCFQLLVVVPSEGYIWYILPFQLVPVDGLLCLSGILDS